MTATDELRALLDERGVEWVHSDDTGWPTTDYIGGYGQRCSAMGEKKRSLTVVMSNLTPEQVIAATLGRWTCYDVGDSTRFVCSECGCSLDLSDLDGEPTMWVKDMAGTPDFCPSCGWRIIDAGEVDG